MREKHFANCQFLSLDDLQEKLCSALSELSSQTEYVRSLTYFPHIRVACESAN